MVTFSKLWWKLSIITEMTLRRVFSVCRISVMQRKSRLIIYLIVFNAAEKRPIKQVFGDMKALQ